MNQDMKHDKAHLDYIRSQHPTSQQIRNILGIYWDGRPPTYGSLLYEKYHNITRGHFGYSLAGQDLVKFAEAVKQIMEDK